MSALINATDYHELLPQMELNVCELVRPEYERNISAEKFFEWFEVES